MEKEINIYQQSIQIQWDITACADALRIQNHDRGIRIFRDLLQKMQTAFQLLLSERELCDSCGIAADGSDVLFLLGGLMDAQREKDYILLADLLELTAEPFFTSLQLHLQEIAAARGETVSLYKDCWSRNLAVLEEQDGKLAELLCRTKRELDKCGTQGMHFAPCSGLEYHIEETRKGYLTLRVVREGRSYYLHSNSDARHEAAMLAGVYADENATEYHVLGCGLFYHVEEIARLSYSAKPIFVYEPDRYILTLALMFGDHSGAMQSYYRVCCDPRMQNLTEGIAREKRGLILHYPSINGIADKEVRASMERFFIKESGMRNQKGLLDVSFRRNIRALESGSVQLADGFLPQMAGRDLYIIAAGPSLDRNIQKMSARNGNAFILAVGTVYRKLMGLGIVPDAVIITDSNDRVISQISGLAGEKVPLLLLSTANWRFAAGYQGEKYLLFQRGYTPAEQEAEKRGSLMVETGGSVSTTALDLAVRAAASRIIFLGLDLAFTDNLAHASGTANRIATEQEVLFPVKAYDGGTVMADHKFIIYREWIEERLRQSDARAIPVINATEGGSYIQGMIHVPLSEAMQEENDIPVS